MAGRGQRQEHRYCALPKAPPPAGPIFSGSSSYNTAVCFNSFSGQMGSNSYGPLHCISLVNVAQCTFPPSSYPDNRWVAASTNRRLALAALPPSQAYFSLSSCQPALCATADHREHLNTKRNPPSSSVQARARLRRNSYPRTAALCHPQIYPVVLVMSPMVQIDHTRATVGARQ